MGNTEGTSEPEDSVETTREEPVKQPQVIDGSECPHCGVLAITPSEALLNRAFRNLSISFATQSVISAAGHDGQRYEYRYQADLLILQKPVVVECDNRYHRVQPGRRELDIIRSENLRKAGYQIFNFSDEQLGEDANACAQLVVEQANLVPEDRPVFMIRRHQDGSASATWQGGKPGWECEACGGHFHSYWRSNHRPCRTCSRECQVIWQRETKASVRNRDEIAKAARMREIWSNPEWRSDQLQRIYDARWGNR